MFVNEETIEKIRNSLDIVEVVGEYVQLKKQGRSHTARCPFHNERTPSFHVSSDKQIFKCFGCGIGGNIFTFIMEIEGLEYLEAVRLLGDKAGVDLPDAGPSRSKEADKKLDALYKGMELLSKLYHYILLETKTGDKARKYLSNRGFTEEVIRTYHLGYAPDSWETAVSFLGRRGFSLSPFAEAGMLAKRSFDGKYFDRFRDRLIFPITDKRGKTVAFAGRVFGDEKPKYLNTPESDIFHKSGIIYGFAEARPAIKKAAAAVLFEGYADVIKARQAGVDYGVASMGTSLTEQQAKQLTRLAETVTICYDSDAAGVNAAFRAVSLLEDGKTTVKIAQMPDGMDPDDYIDQYGADAFKDQVLGASQTVTSFKMSYLRRDRNMNDEGDRLRYIEEVLSEIAKLNKAVERDHYLRQLADEFDLSLDALKQQQYQLFKQQQRRGNTDRSNSRPASLKARRHLDPASVKAEKHLIAHMLRHEHIAERVQDELGGNFNVPEHQALVARLYSYYADGNLPDMNGFLRRLNDIELQKAAASIAMLDISNEPDGQEISDYIRFIKKYSRLMEIKQNEAELSKESDEVKRAQLLAEIIMMKKAIDQEKKVSDHLEGGRSNG